MFYIHKGINLSHWLSQVFGWSPRESYITEQDIIQIKNMGFDHVRLPIDEEEMWDEHLHPYENAFSYLHSCIQWCLTHNLKVVIDLHILRSHHFNNANDEGAMTLWSSTSEQDRMMEIWTKLSAELKQYSNSQLAYEFMNEPVAPKHSQWNDLVARGHKHLRELEPERTLIFGPNMWQMPAFFKSFKIPAHDSRLLISFHTYDPMPFTHYKAPWLPLGDYNGKVQYPGTIIPEEHLQEFLAINGNSEISTLAAKKTTYSKEEMEKTIAPALEFAKQHNLPLYCNEFGCLPTVDRAQRLQYYQDLIATLQAHSIAYAAWDYKGDFGIAEWDRENNTNTTVDTELAHILTHNYN